MKKFSSTLVLLCLSVLLTFLLAACGTEEPEVPEDPGDIIDGVCPNTLYWDGQFYRGYGEEVHNIEEGNIIGEIQLRCSSMEIPKKHGEANCMDVGCPIAKNGNELAILFKEEWTRFYPISTP